MKRSLLALTMLLIIMKLHGQSTWEYMIPDYTNGTIAKSSFINDEEGWIIIVNQIWHTQDGGSTWEKNPFELNINQFEFKDQNIGFAINDTSVFKTGDGGATWNVLDVPGSPYYSIYFLNTDTGFIGGHNEIYKTQDGGVSWSTIPSFPGYVRDFHFINDSTGFSVSETSIIYKTVDNGETWYEQYVNPSYYYTAIVFLDEDTGIAYGYYNGFDDEERFIDNTTDGGNTWNPQSEGGHDLITDLVFRNNAEVFAVTEYEYLFSPDGGESWSETYSLPGITQPVYSFDGFHDLYAFGDLGEMFKLPEDSLSWQSISENYDGITSVRNHSFASPDTGWFLDYSKVFKTTDGGITWISVSNIALDLIDAVTADLLFAVRSSSIYDDSCFVYSSSDGGSTWNLVFAHDFAASQLQMIDGNTGYILSYDGSISKTSDGGTTWSETEIGTGDFTAMHFLNENEGWVLKGDWGDNAVYHTADGGSTWDMIYEYTGFGWYLVDVFFLDSQHGWIVHSHAQTDDDADYSATDNGGATWTDHLLSSDFFYSHLNHSVYFESLQHGWLVDERVLYETTDGGNSWSPVFDPPATQRRIEYVSNEAIYVSGHGTWLAKGSFCPVQSAFIYSVSEFTVQLTDLSTGVTSWAWDFGDGDTSTEQNPFHSYTGPGTYNVCLIATGDCGTDTSCQNIFVDYPVNAPSSNGHELIEWSLFPNPFSSSTTIHFNIFQSSHVFIKVYGLRGKEMETLLDGDVERGEHSLLLNNFHFSKGVYLLKMVSDFGIENQKLIVQ